VIVKHTERNVLSERCLITSKNQPASLAHVLLLVDLMLPRSYHLASAFASCRCSLVLELILASDGALVVTRLPRLFPMMIWQLQGRVRCSLCLSLLLEK